MAPHNRNKGAIVRKTEGFSLLDFPEYDPTASIVSPRSILACNREGIDVLDLQYKPLEAFNEANLSPRLVKLRYDFFEAKRKDLLSAARRSRQKLVREQTTGAESHTQSLPNLTAGGISIHDIGDAAEEVATRQLNGFGIVNLERRKLERIVDHEKRWLLATLGHELNLLKKMDKDDRMLTEEGDRAAEKMRQDAVKMKALNDKRRAEEERKQDEMAAQQRMEKDMAKREFLRQQAELAKEQENENQRRQAAHERSLADAERRKQMDREKQEAQERAWQEQQQKLEEMRNNDDERMRIMGKLRGERDRAFSERLNARNDRIMKSIACNEEMEMKRRQAYMDKIASDKARDERLSLRRHMQQEEGAKRSLQLMIKRQNIMNEAQRKLDGWLQDRRRSILDHQEETEQRLLEHELKKERYLEFKRELDGLKQANKELNVLRQRRREEHRRNMVAKEVAYKDGKASAVKQERERLWGLRRRAGLEAYTSREAIKQSIMDMRIKSKFDPQQAEKMMRDMLGRDIFNTQKPAL